MTKEIEGVDYVVCQICRRKLKRINALHLRIHNISVYEYKQKYPNTLMISDKSRKMTSISGIGRINTQETIKQMRESANKRWEDKSQRTNMSMKMTEIANRPEEKERRSISCEMNWKNPIIRQKMIAGIIKSWEKPGHRELISNILSELQKNGGFSTGYKHTFEAKQKISNRFLGIPKTPEHCQNMSKNHWDESMEKNPNWQGGKSFEKYPKDFWLIRPIILEMYNNCDYISGLSQSICNPYRSLSIHHIDYDKTNNINNLIPLSDKNHTITNYRRIFWKQLFKYSLKYEKEYYSFDIANGIKTIQ